jgi:hypothetical protein
VFTAADPNGVLGYATKLSHSTSVSPQRLDLVRQNLEDVTGQVFWVLDFEGDFPAFGGDFAPRFYIVAFVPTEIASGRH